MKQKLKQLVLIIFTLVLSCGLYAKGDVPDDCNYKNKDEILQKISTTKANEISVSYYFLCPYGKTISI
jgi:hypothetical protein